MATVVLIGTLDTKGAEYAFLRARVEEESGDVLLVDVGILGVPGISADVSRDEVGAAAGTTIAALIAADRGIAVAAMARGATVVAERLFREGRLHGIAALGGSGGTTIATAAMRALPIGVPKLMVSTLAAGDTRPYVGASDIMMLYSVVDIAGLNRISVPILTNAAAAITAMARAHSAFRPTAIADRPLIGATMFGVTTEAVTEGRRILEERGYEVLVFHATGTGGQSMEALIAGGFLAGVFDLTTTELADELVGGVLSAGPERLESAGRAGLPQVVSLGALDMVNFGPRAMLPERFHDRTIHEHNPTVTLMRTNPEEAAQLGGIIARKLNAATGPVALFLPLRGISAIAGPGGPFYDPVADEALFAALRATLRPDIERHELDLAINDPHFARAMAERLDEMVRAQ